MVGVVAEGGIVLDRPREDVVAEEGEREGEGDNK